MGASSSATPSPEAFRIPRTPILAWQAGSNSIHHIIRIELNSSCISIMLRVFRAAGTTILE